ncbi:MAG: ABC transporter permease [Anaerolineae bacterium]
MIKYLARRFVYAIGLLVTLSIVSFAIIQAPPGDYLSTYIARLSRTGQQVSDAQVQSLRKEYGLDKPLPLQYIHWMGKVLRGDLGRSFELNRPVRDLIAERLPLTLLVMSLSLAFTYILGILIGIYSATHQYSLMDHVFTVFSFAGIAIPGFFFALLFMFLGYKYLGLPAGGLFSVEHALESTWSWAKLGDLLTRLPIPILIIGLSGTGWLVRVMRGTLLDELNKAYVVTARAKGQREITLLFRYPVRVALNPVISTLGWEIPYLISGETIVDIVLGLPTTSPLLFRALIAQDMYLAGSIILLLSVMTVVGTFASDILLALVDPRIRIAA